MRDCKKLTKEEALVKVFECEPIMNFIRNDDIFKKEIILTGWHYSHNLYKFADEISKLTELLGEPVSKGTSFGKTSFFRKTIIWPFSYKEDGAIFVVYLSKEGLFLEVNDKALKNIEDIFNVLISTIVNEKNMPFLP